VQVFAESGDLLGDVSFTCHPEFDEFEFYQRKKTDELLEIVADRLQSGMAQHQFTEIWKCGLAPTLRFNAPDQNLPRLVPDGVDVE
jgi:hypothetical protein